MGLTNAERADFAGLLETHHRYLSGFCCRLAGSDDTGRDLYHQAVLTALEKLKTLRDRERFRPWLASIIVNQHRSLRRRERFRRLFSLELLRDNGQLAINRREPATPAPDLDDARRLRLCLDRLPAAQREAVILHEVEGFNQAEVAEIQRCSLSAAKTRVSRARRELKRLWQAGDVPTVAGQAKEEKAHELKIRLEQ